MEKLIEVEEAKAVMTEAIDWSVMKWLREKKRVRHMADRANAALDAAIAKLKAGFEGNFKTAYENGNAKEATSDLMAMVKKFRHAEQEAKAARDDAENTFDDAEKQLSTSMAREGCRKAIHSWEAHERVIRLAENHAAKVKA